MTIGPKNRASSVRARLLNRSRERGWDFNLLLQRYAAERFLYRLGASRYRATFVLKGAMLFSLWGGAMYRATRDLDLTGYTQDDPGNLVKLLTQICDVPCPEDGLRFDSSTIQAEPIRAGNEYHGYRAKMLIFLGSARIPLQIDVGFGNAIEPPALDEEYPVLLDGPAPNIRAYPREAVVAEKLHAMVVHGETNSRFKDFYDLFCLATLFPFDGATLSRAIAKTFERRATSMRLSVPLSLTPVFYADPQRDERWRSYLKRYQLPNAPPAFSELGERIRLFVGPIWIALAGDEEFKSIWPTEGPWAGQ